MEFVRGEGGLDDFEEDELLPRMGSCVNSFVRSIREFLPFDWCVMNTGT